MASNKDSKGRNLKDYEYQMPDGRYRFRYTDKNGERKAIYSWKLVEKDKVPSGKRDCRPLRDIEKQILKDLDDGIDTAASNMTLNEVWEKYISMKTNLKTSTLNNYKYNYDHFVRDAIGRKKIKDFKYSDVKKFYVQLMKDGMASNTVDNIHTLLHPVFTLAVRDGIIRSNPSDNVCAEIKKNSEPKSEKVHALTIEETELLSEYMKQDAQYNHWLPLFTFFLGTGMRISEIVGLRWSDVDFKNNTISVNHNTLYRRKDGGGVEWSVSTPKTEKGCRTIPMFAQVREALLQTRKEQMQLGVRCQNNIDGYTDFIFLNRFGNIFIPMDINRAFIRIYTGANDFEEKRAKEENRKPVVIRHFSAHCLRHTFCTRLCEVEPNVKLIQDIMGHADAQTTLNIYTEVQESKKKSAFAELQNKMKIC